MKTITKQALLYIVNALRSLSNVFLRILIAIEGEPEPVPERTPEDWEKPNLAAAHEALVATKERFDDITFYMSQIPVKYPALMGQFINTAEFNLASVRDELKILLDQEIENARTKEHTNDLSRGA